MFERAVLFAALAASPLLASADIPETRVGPFTFHDAPFATALAKVVEGTGVSVVMKDDIQGTLSAADVSGKLNIVVGKMCAYSSAKCEFKDDAIVVTDRNKVPADTAAQAASPAAKAGPDVSATPVVPVEAVATATSTPASTETQASTPANDKPTTQVVAMAVPKEVAPVPKVIDEKVATPVAPPAPVAAPAPLVEKPSKLEYRTVPLVSFTVLNGEGLRSALVRAASNLGVNVSWSLPEDRIASRDMTFTGKRDEVLNDLLTEFHLPGYLVADTNTLYIVKDSKQ